MTDRETKLLVIAMEECSELIKECSELQQEISKGIRFGMDNVYQDNTVIEKMYTEYLHIQASMEMLEENGIIKNPYSSKEVREIVEKKKQKVQSYF